MEGSRTRYLKQEPVAGAVGVTTLGQVTPSLATLPQNYLGAGSINIVPASATTVGNCIPFGSNLHSFSGFIYRNVPPFVLVAGAKFAFDLGAQNDVDIRRNIFFATANKNPSPPVNFGSNVLSQGIFAASGWTQIVSDNQVPQGSPRGNFVKGDYELIYTAEAPFSFPGGGLIIGFGGSPPGTFADAGCEQVLVQTTNQDASGFFYARFWWPSPQDHLTLGVLDSRFSGGTGIALGGVVIQTVLSVDIDIRARQRPELHQLP